MHAGVRLHRLWVGALSFDKSAAGISILGDLHISQGIIDGTIVLKRTSHNSANGQVTISIRMANHEAQRQGTEKLQKMSDDKVYELKSSCAIVMMIDCEVCNVALFIIPQVKERVVSDLTIKIHT